MIRAIVATALFAFGLLLVFIWALVSPGFQAGDYLFSIVLSILLLAAAPLGFGLRDALKG